MEHGWQIHLHTKDMLIKQKQRFRQRWSHKEHAPATLNHMLLMQTYAHEESCASWLALITILRFPCNANACGVQMILNDTVISFNGEVQEYIIPSWQLVCHWVIIEAALSLHSTFQSQSIQITKLYPISSHTISGPSRTDKPRTMPFKSGSKHCQNKTINSRHYSVFMCLDKHG